MNKVRVVYRADNGVSIIYPALNSRRADEMETDWLERVFTKCMHGDLEGRPYDDIDLSELPQSREDRDAWTGRKGQGIWVDKKKAQKLKMEKQHQKLIKEEIEKIAIERLEARGLLP